MRKLIYGKKIFRFYKSKTNLENVHALIAFNTSTYKTKYKTNIYIYCVYIYIFVLFCFFLF